MPEIGNAMGNASNAKGARIIERECEFNEEIKDKAITNFQSMAWKQETSMYASYQVCVFSFLLVCTIKFE